MGQQDNLGDGESLEQAYARGVRRNFEHTDRYFLKRMVPPITQLGYTPSFPTSMATDVGFGPYPQADAYVEPQVGPPGYHAPYISAGAYAPAPFQSYAPQYGPYTSGQQYLSGIQIHLLGQQAGAYERHGKLAPAIQLDNNPPDHAMTLGATPIGRMRATRPWPKYQPTRIVHTCEDAVFVTRFKIGVWVNRVDHPVDAPERKVIVPGRDGTTEEIWRCGKWACRFCKRTADGYTDLVASVAASHGITGVPVKDRDIGQTQGVFVQSNRRETTGPAAAFTALESHRSAPVSVPGRAQSGLDRGRPFEQTTFQLPMSHTIDSLGNVNDTVHAGHKQAAPSRPAAESTETGRAINVKTEELQVSSEPMRQRRSRGKLMRPGRVLAPQKSIDIAPQQPWSHNGAMGSGESRAPAVTLPDTSGVHSAGQLALSPGSDATNGKVVTRDEGGEDETPRVETRSAKLLRAKREIALVRSWPLTD